MLKVIHLQGFVDNDANRAYSTGPDFITSQLVGPELRLVSMLKFIYRSLMYRYSETPFSPHLQIYLTNTGKNIYEGAVSSVIAGNYTFDVTVVHTPYTVNETLGAKETWPFMFTRNLVLINNAVGTEHSLTVKCILKLLIVAPDKLSLFNTRRGL